MWKTAGWIFTTLTIIFCGCGIIPSNAITPDVSKNAALTKTIVPTIHYLPTTPVTATPSRTAPIRWVKTQTPYPTGCQTPLEDYSLVTVRGFILNRRTFEMLKHATALYGGEINITGNAITQGSYNDNGAASFGTHLGGGAVDLSIMRHETYDILYDEIEPLITAMRLAGFAAWLRDFNEIYSGSPIHIHAIAIGDQQLSEAARQQLIGNTGYFRGMTGLPDTISPPTPDRYGGPVICGWMLEKGYRDLRRPEKLVP